MEELLDEFLDTHKLPKDNFKVWLNYQGPIATREYEQMDDFTHVCDLSNAKEKLELLMPYAKLVSERTESFDPTLYIVTHPIKFLKPLDNTNDMLNVLALSKAPITKYVVLKENAGEHEIRFFTMNDGAITMFILFADRLHCCCVDNLEKYILDIDDGFVSVTGQPIRWGEYALAFNKWKASGYTYKLRINLNTP
jgi:hypothetical protein